MSGKYERTDSHRKLISEIAKKVNSRRSDKEKNDIVEKRKQTIKEKNIKVGRKCGILHSIKCIQCSTLFEEIPSKKTRKYCSKICYYNSKKGKICIDPEISRNMDRSYMKTEKYSFSKRKFYTKEYVRYRNLVYKLSNITYNNNFNIINPNNYSRTLCGVDGGYQLDHIKSIKQCFIEGIFPEEASTLSNLQLLPWKVNLIKGC